MNAKQLHQLFYGDNVDPPPNNEFKPNVDDQFGRFPSCCVPTAQWSVEFSSSVQPVLMIGHSISVKGGLEDPGSRQMGEKGIPHHPVLFSLRIGALSFILCYSHPRFAPFAAIIWCLKSKIIDRTETLLTICELCFSMFLILNKFTNYKNWFPRINTWKLKRVGRNS